MEEVERHGRCEPLGVSCGCGVTRRKLQTPGNAEEHKKNKKHLQSTQSAQPKNLTDQAPSTTERTARETHNTKQHSSRARFSTTTHHQHPHATGSSQDLFSQRSGCGVRPQPQHGGHAYGRMQVGLTARHRCEPSMNRNTMTCLAMQCTARRPRT